MRTRGGVCRARPPPAARTALSGPEQRRLTPGLRREAKPRKQKTGNGKGWKSVSQEITGKNHSK